MHGVGNILLPPVAADRATTRPANKTLDAMMPARSYRKPSICLLK